MRRALLLGAVLAVLLAGSAQAGYEVVLPRAEARQMVRESGGFVHHCKRLTPHRFICRATYWRIRHEAEEVEPGILVEISSEPVAEERQVAVGLIGVSLRPRSRAPRTTTSVLSQ